MDPETFRTVSAEEHTPQALVDRAFRVHAATDGFLEAVSGNRDDVIGTPAYDLFPGLGGSAPEPVSRRHRQALEQVVRDRKPARVEPPADALDPRDGTAPDPGWHLALLPLLDERGDVQWILERVEGPSENTAPATGPERPPERFREALHATVAERVRVGLWLVDPDGRTLHANPPLATFLHTPLQELTDRRLQEFLDEEQHARLCDQMAASASLEVASGEYRFQREDGRPATARVDTAPVPDPSDGPPAILLIVEDVTQARQAAQDLELRTRAVEAASNGLVITGPVEDDNRLIYVNPAFEKMTGYSAEELLGRNCRFLQTPDTDETEVQKVRDALAAEREGRAVLLNERKDGTRFWNEIFISPVRGQDGHADHWVGVMADVTERIRAEQAIRDLTRTLETRVADRTRDLERTNEELEAFSYSVSHDLRTPLRALHVFLDALEEDYAATLDAEGRDLLDRTRRAADRMDELIEDLLRLFRVARHPLRPRPVDLDELAQQVVSQLRAAHPDRQVDVRIQPDLHAQADPRLLRIALENLIGNAWKYTRPVAEARIEIGQEVTRDGETTFFVRDNGVGFDPTRAAGLFQPFQRLHGPTQFEGSGIGLAIVDRVLRHHGGHVSAESRPGEGATFRFTLPARPPASD